MQDRVKVTSASESHEQGRNCWAVTDMALIPNLPE
jgi:hypothetical protein